MPADTRAIRGSSPTPVQTSVAIRLVLSVDTGAALDEHSSTLAISSVGSKQERRVALERRRVRVRTGVKQGLNNFWSSLHLTTIKEC